MANHIYHGISLPDELRNFELGSNRKGLRRT